MRIIMKRLIANNYELSDSQFDTLVNLRNVLQEVDYECYTKNGDWFKDEVLTKKLKISRPLDNIINDINEVLEENIS